jgi:hypothetical protein
MFARFLLAILRKRKAANIAKTLLAKVRFRKHCYLAKSEFTNWQILLNLFGRFDGCRIGFPRQQKNN